MAVLEEWEEPVFGDEALEALFRILVNMGVDALGREWWAKPLRARSRPSRRFRKLLKEWVLPQLAGHGVRAYNVVARNSDLDAYAGVTVKGEHPRAGYIIVSVFLWQIEPIDVGEPEDAWFPQELMVLAGIMNGRNHRPILDLLLPRFKRVIPARGFILDFQRGYLRAVGEPDWMIVLPDPIAPRYWIQVGACWEASLKFEDYKEKTLPIPVPRLGRRWIREVMPTYSNESVCVEMCNRIEQAAIERYLHEWGYTLDEWEQRLLEVA